MAITLQGVKLTQVSISFDEQGMKKVSGSYQLLSNTGTVLAKNDFNGYGDIKLGIQGDLAGKVDDVVNGIKAELNKVLGLE